MDHHKDYKYQASRHHDDRQSMFMSQPMIHSEVSDTYYPSYTMPHLNDYDQYPSFEEFEIIIQDYLKNLSSKKRDKALIDRNRYVMILQVLKDPRNTAISTAQFRFWVKKMFQLHAKQVVCHDGKPVATREEIYGILVHAHREAHHGGRDKTSALVRRRYSWIPKELIARFVRHCPFCIARRNGNQQSSLPFDTYYDSGSPTYQSMHALPKEQPKCMMDAHELYAQKNNVPYSNDVAFLAHTEKDQRRCSLKDQSPISVDAPWQHQDYYNICHYEGSTGNPPINAPSSPTAVEATTTTALFNDNGSGGYYSHDNTAGPSFSYMTYSHQVPSSVEPLPAAAMQTVIPAYYMHENGLKQNSGYSLTDNSTNFMYAAHPSARNYDVYYHVNPSSERSSNEMRQSTPSPSMSPSSSSSSSASSPEQFEYVENCIQSRRQYITPNPATAPIALNILSHQQSLLL
ncbi:hypothetical protein RMATCC62417_03511 [Rhizopus microsporus]|nr:hypothetical protein RMATCC62417_03511 [Rhizopus microsporus]